MIVSVTLPLASYQVNTACAWPIAIPMNFNRAQPNHFGADIATATPMQAEGFIGDTQQGGSCNVNQLSLNPHCNGTHTETLAHICDSSASLSLKIADLQIAPLMPCVLLSITPDNAVSSSEQYTPEFALGDQIISKEKLAAGLDKYHPSQLQCVVIRTLPNSSDKCLQAYNQDNQPAFLSRDAVGYLNQREVEHLVVDVPSLDRLYDEGLMTCHHLFWQVAEGSHQPGPDSLINKTITELAYINNQIEDGFYFISLQTPAFVNDAAPSRPVLYPAVELPSSPL